MLYPRCKVFFAQGVCLASEQRLAFFVLHSGVRAVGMAMHNQLSDKPSA